MAKAIIDENILSDIADEINIKNGTNVKYKDSELANGVANIETGKVDSVNGQVGDVVLSAADVGARPDTWVPTAADVKARPDTWNPDLSGLVPKTTQINNKPLNGNISLSAADVGARPDTWVPTAADVKARPDTWNPDLSGLVPKTTQINNKPLNGNISLSAADVGARPSNWTPNAADVGAAPKHQVSTADLGEGKNLATGTLYIVY